VKSISRGAAAMHPKIRRKPGVVLGDAKSVAGKKQICYGLFVREKPATKIKKQNLNERTRYAPRK
jgi:hypothetical protein